MDTNEQMEKVLADQLEIISHMEVGTDPHTNAVRAFDTLNDAYLERLRFDSECKQKEEERLNEAIKLADARIQNDRENRDRLVGRVIEGVKLVGFAAFVVGTTAVGYRFEQEGALTSQTFKRFQDFIWKSMRL